MFLLAQTPRFNTASPGVLSSENANELTVSLPILNIGTADAANMTVTNITLGSAGRLSPAGLPWFIGDLGVGGSVSVTARFDSSGLIVGGRYLMTVQGTYEADNATFGFAVNRFIVIPAVSPPDVLYLKAHVTVSTESGTWSYSIFNDEALKSSQFIAAFSLDVVTPFAVTGTPTGWQVETDNLSYVLWFAADEQLPYKHHIPPGESLEGFQIQSTSNGSESTAYIVTAWDHQSNDAGLVSPDVVLSPSRMG
jgi:hypothetical protein